MWPLKNKIQESLFQILSIVDFVSIQTITHGPKCLPTGQISPDLQTPWYFVKWTGPSVPPLPELYKIHLMMCLPLLQLLKRLTVGPKSDWATLGLSRLLSPFLPGWGQMVGTCAGGDPSSRLRTSTVTAVAQVSSSNIAEVGHSSWKQTCRQRRGPTCSPAAETHLDWASSHWSLSCIVTPSLLAHSLLLEGPLRG